MTDEMNFEDFVELERIYNPNSLSREEAIIMLKNHLDKQLAVLRQEKSKLTHEDYRKDPEAFRIKNGAILNRMVYCDYRKELKWAETDHAQLEKKLEEHASRYNGEDSGSIIMDIRSRFNGNMANSDLYSVRLLLRVIEGKPQDYPVAEGLVNKLLN